MSKRKESAVATGKDSATPMITQKDIPLEVEKLEKILSDLTSSVDEKVSTKVKYGTVQIDKVTTVKELLEISASIHARGEAFEKEKKRYKLDGKLDEFTTSSKTVKEWEKIITKAISELVNKVQIENVKTAIEKLSSHLDAETKLQKSLNDIMKLANQTIK